VRINGNPGLCGGPLDLHLLACHVTHVNSSKQRHFIVQKVVIPLSSILSLAIVIAVTVVWRGKPKKNKLSVPSFSSKFPKVSSNDLAKATCGFSSSNLISKGRYSSLYKGKLYEGRTMVASGESSHEVHRGHHIYTVGSAPLLNCDEQSLSASFA
jgi:hypothetical protein